MGRTISCVLALVRQNASDNRHLTNGTNADFMYSISNIEKTENLILQVSQLKHRVDNLENVLRNGKEVLTLEEASLYTGISRSTLYKLTSAHEIPYYKPHGKLILFERKELLAWVRANRIAAKDEDEDVD